MEWDDPFVWSKEARDWSRDMSLWQDIRGFVRRLLHPPASGRNPVEHDGTELAKNVRDAFGPAEGGVDGGGGSGHRYFEGDSQRDRRPD